MRDFDKVAASLADVVTRAEWLHLQQQRQRPEQVRHLTPNNEMSADIKAQDASRSEDRIAFLRGRLDRSQQGLEQDFGFARIEGHAKADFERGR